MDQKTVAVFGTMDTKGENYFFLRRCLEEAGISVIMIDTGSVPDPRYPCDITPEEVARAGGSELSELKKHERVFAFQVMGNGSAVLISDLARAGKIQGAISLGGGQGTLLAAMVMKRLPAFFPKMIVSTIVNLRTPPFEGVRDTACMNSLVDVSGMNHILEKVLRNAAASMAGMVLFGAYGRGTEPERKTVAMSMFGVTTPCVDRVRGILEKDGYEVIVFHANGLGGNLMESMIREGQIGAVADITTGEIAQELLGGNCSAGPHRLEAAPEAGIPQVIVPGAMELANFMPPSSLPEKYAGRMTYMHNPNLKLLRANAEESALAGQILAEKVNRSAGPVCVLLPLRGISLYDRQDGPMPDPEADAALFKAIRENLRDDIPCREYDLHINDPEFAEHVAEALKKIY